MDPKTPILTILALILLLSWDIMEKKPVIICYGMNLKDGFYFLPKTK